MSQPGSLNTNVFNLPKYGQGGVLGGGRSGQGIGGGIGSYGSYGLGGLGGGIGGGLGSGGRQGLGGLGSAGSSGKELEKGEFGGRH